MMQPTSKFAAAILAAAVLGGTAACTGSSSPATPTVAAPSTSGGSTAATQPTSASTATPAAPATSASPSSAASGHVVAAGGACTGSEIKVALGQSGAATGHHIVTLDFTNTGSRTCALQGYPGAAIVNGSTTILNAKRTLNGFAGDNQQLSSAPLVTLSPGATAYANLEWVVDNGEPCGPNGTGMLAVTPPNTTSTAKLMSLTSGTQGVCADFEVHPVVASVH
ncbi:MAG TPA: DUF4232 domain-containing protein [Actinospica sp.]|jgi:hypothetical protein|nr:DUF4232 domain-containing protein [Actinospica sp.]